MIGSVGGSSSSFRCGVARFLRAISGSLAGTERRLARGGALRNDRRGAILPIAAVSIFILFALAALALDISAILATKHRLRRSMDAAGLAIATHLKLNTPTQDELEAFTRKWLQANYPNKKIGKYVDLSVSWDGTEAHISAKGKVDTLFMGALLGVSDVVADVDVKVISETRGLEVALALDNSGSMNGTEIAWLRKSVNDFINTLYANSSEPDTVKVGMVPFVAAVNVKDPAEFAADWVDTADPTHVRYMDDLLTVGIPPVSYHGENFTPQTSHAFLHHQYSKALFGASAKWYASWKGCVEARTATWNGNELDVTDVPPDPAIPDTLFVPYFWPDDPDNTVASSSTKDNGALLITSDASLPTTNSQGNTEAHNNRMNDFLDPDTLDSDPLVAFMQRLTSVAKYLDPANVAAAAAKNDEVPSITFGPNKSCPDPITPLSNSQSDLINKLQAGYIQNWNEGGTAIAQGLMWAWRVLSAAPPFSQGAPYVNADGTVNKSVRKVIVLFVDGENGITVEKNPVYSSYSAYGYIKPGGRLDPMGSNDLNTKTQKVCANARAPADGQAVEKITMYAVIFGASSGDPIVNFLATCVGDRERVLLAATTSDLNAVFISLAESLTRLRVAD